MLKKNLAGKNLENVLPYFTQSSLQVACPTFLIMKHHPLLEASGGYQSGWIGELRVKEEKSDLRKFFYARDPNHYQETRISPITDLLSIK